MGITCGQLRRFGTSKNRYITEKKKQIDDPQYKKIDGEKIFSICSGILMHSECVMITGVLQKRILKDFHTGHRGISRIKVLMRSYVFLAKYGPRNWRKCKVLQSLCDGRKAPPVKFTCWPKTELGQGYKDFAGARKGRYYLIWKYMYIYLNICVARYMYIFM